MTSAIPAVDRHPEGIQAVPTDVTHKPQIERSIGMSWYGHLQHKDGHPSVLERSAAPAHAATAPGSLCGVRL